MARRDLGNRASPVDRAHMKRPYKSGESFVGKGCKYKPYFAREMAEEYAVNIEPYQFELMSSESDGETILMM